MRPVVLRGEKVSLGILLKEDLRKSWEWYNERSTVRNFFNSAYFTLPEEEEEFYEELKKNKEKAPAFAVLKNDGTLIGIAGFNWANWSARWGELFYYLAPEERGKGYGTEVVRLLCEYAFRHLNLRKVWAKVHSDNIPSIRVLEKNGFSLSGRFREHVWSDGRYLDELIYEKFRSSGND
ncbi:GNAT family N-acetyltransferase [Thermococcus sp. AM4]|uniref:GNAT family N-acetyltransferase n=1 Tax=Thermococcus sp. (strain AM4) TaxID=246969 RepID=UPI00018707CF|nr:GNAT family protein [Thermococcus sp. AM4]EEB74411.1 N-acetyltransferase, GNAT family [Thermococcus sp. AM4]